MAAHVTFAFSHDFNDDDFELQSGFPAEMPAGVSLTVVLTVLAGAAALDCSSMAVYLKGRPLNSQLDEVLLSTGAVSGVGNNVLTFTVNKDQIPTGWGLYDECRFSFHAVNGAGQEQFRIFQEGIRILSETDPEDEDYPYTEDITVSHDTYAADVSVDNEPGLQFITLNTAAAQRTATLPTTGTYPGQLIWIVRVGANNGVINPNGKTINGVAGNQTLSLDYDNMLLQEQDDGNWLAYGPALIP